MMMKKTLLMVCSLAALLLAGCANTDTNLARETARSIGGVTSDQVLVENVKRGVTDVRWTAKTPDRTYHCEADDMVHRVNCVPDAN